MENDSYLTVEEVTQIASLLALFSDDDARQSLSALSMEIRLSDCNGEPAGIIVTNMVGIPAYYPNGPVEE